MSKLDKTTIVYNGMSDTIYVAQFGAKEGLALHKIDRTDHFLRTLLQWCPPDTVREIGNDHGPKYKITVEEIVEEEVPAEVVQEVSL